MVRPILRFGTPLLREPARPVESFGPELQLLVEDMLETMRRAPGIGLAAPQVGVPLRLFVVDLSVATGQGHPIVFVNPSFVSREGMQLEEEGCLSVPGFNATVARPRRAVLRGLTRDGHLQEIEATGLLARAVQHEMDHLDGRLFVDRLRSISQRWITGRVERLRLAGKW